MSKSCLALGIKKTAGLDDLPGAINGAKAFAKWAQLIGANVELVVDDNGPITIDEIRSTLLKLLPAPRGRSLENSPRNPPEHLILYFAGHGFTRDAGEDMWLVSESKYDQKAIGISALRAKLQEYGVQYVSIFSDACRSSAGSDWSKTMVVDAVLPLGPYDLDQVDIPLIDSFQASSKFRAAYMLPGPSDDKSKCIFSGVLMEGLQGKATDRNQPKLITNFALAEYLDTHVPAKAKQYKVSLRPHNVTGLRPNKNIYFDISENPDVQFPPPIPWPNLDDDAHSQGFADYVADRVQNPRGIKRARTGKSSHKKKAVTISRSRDSWNSQKSRSVQKQMAIEARSNDQSAAMLYRFANESRPDHFETGSGMAVNGRKVKSIWLPLTTGAERAGDANQWWRFFPREENERNMSGTRLRHSAPLLVELASGNFVGAASVPDFVTSFTLAGNLRQTHCQGLIYRAVHSSKDTAAESEKAIALMRGGSIGTEQALNLAMKLRNSKHADFIMGVISAYLYHAQGDIGSIRKMAWFYANRNQPIPFDIALLGQLFDVKKGRDCLRVVVPATTERRPISKGEEENPGFFRSTPSIKADIVGQFPWMTQGWSLMNPATPEPLVHRAILNLKSHLVRAPFTTLTPEGGRRLATTLGMEETA